MNPRRAQAIRREIYGDFSPRHDVRKYFLVSRTGQVVSDERRRAYQDAKKAWNRRSRKH